jgi:hypothetical protein
MEEDKKGKKKIDKNKFLKKEAKPTLARFRIRMKAPLTPTMKVSPPSPSKSPPSSPRLVISASWPRRAKIRYILEALLNILSLVMMMKILVMRKI